MLSTATERTSDIHAFGKVWGASGVQGFFGEGYWFHKPLQSMGLLDFSGVTFSAKTATVLYNRGNMALNPDFTPRDKFPDCIVVKPLQGIALNAVGLSNPGIDPLLERNEWQSRTDRFFISFMAIARTLAERLQELRNFVAILKKRLPTFRGKVGLQLNYSCPNTGHDPQELLAEIFLGLDIVRDLGIAIVVKLNALVAVKTAHEISKHEACDALLISNAIPYGQLSHLIPWKKIFGEQSPLAKYGGGGLSGKFLLPILIDWLKQARVYGITKPINAGGGILSVSDAFRVRDAGATSISLGSIAFLRPQQISKIVTAVNRDW